MRLKKLEIKDYNQFEHLVLDLTFPEGHDKAGLPLDKICIIGDNGTGKTTILKQIKLKYQTKNEQPSNFNLSEFVTIQPTSTIKTSKTSFSLS